MFDYREPKNWKKLEKENEEIGKKEKFLKTERVQAFIKLPGNQKIGVEVGRCLNEFELLKQINEGAKKSLISTALFGLKNEIRVLELKKWQTPHYNKRMLEKIQDKINKLLAELKLIS